MAVFSEPDGILTSEKNIKAALTALFQPAPDRLWQEFGNSSRRITADQTVTQRYRPSQLLECDTHPNAFYGLLTRRIPETKPKDLGSVPSGVSG